MKKGILIVILCLACIASYAQQKRKKKLVRKPVHQTQPAPVVNNTPPPPVADTSKKVVATVPAKHFDRPRDGYYTKSDIVNARVTPYPFLREVDVAFQKRVWREIDVREKMNQYLASPKQNLITVLLDAIAAGELTAYDATTGRPEDVDGDAFSKPLTAAEARNALVPNVAQDTYDANHNKTTTIVAGVFTPDSILKFRIKEDWIFDKQRSVFEPRIVGIAPMVPIKENHNEFQPAFWVYFPDARQLLATKEVVSRRSDATGLSFDDVFMKRLFTSYIVKESNDRDERIKDYKDGIDKLYEAERIKKELKDWELNLWQY